MKLSSTSTVVHLGLTLCGIVMIALAGGCSNADGKAKGGRKMAIQITSSAFAQGQPIPKQYTGEGADVSPPLAWSGLPAGTKELALICDDPDAPQAEPWVHWVIYKIPADAKGLGEGVPRDRKLKEPFDALQGKNSWPAAEAIGYRGPMPPPGKVHRYYFKLYALDVLLQAEPGLEKKALLAQMKGHVVGEGELMGTYKR
jgi:Raf kinase inhibitor-like YbhB/YbcL family protein